jgi:hypothetical protein
MNSNYFMSNAITINYFDYFNYFIAIIEIFKINFIKIKYFRYLTRPDFTATAAVTTSELKKENELLEKGLGL